MGAGAVYWETSSPLYGGVAFVAMLLLALLVVLLLRKAISELRERAQSNPFGQGV
jgi:hypothetical protein